MKLQFYIASADAIEEISKQIKTSYTSAYRGFMDDSYLDSLQDDHWRPILQNSIGKGDTCIAVKHEESVIGSAIFSRVEAEQVVLAELHAIYLLPHYIGCGVGHQLYQRVEDEMRRQGCTACILEVLSANARAIRFYLSHGYFKVDSFTVEENGMTLACDKMVKSL